MQCEIHLKDLVLLFVICLISHFGEAQSRSGKAKVIRNCTGTYLQFRKNNYRVCNSGAISGFEDNEKIRVKVREMPFCPEIPGEICALYFEHKGAIEITKIKSVPKDS